MTIVSDPRVRRVRKSLLALALLLAPVSAIAADDVHAALGRIAVGGGILWTTEGSNGATIFNWDAVRACAREPYKPMVESRPDETIEQIREDAKTRRWNEILFAATESCRMALISRHDGWAAATDKPDPILPEPLMRDDDFK